MLDFCRAFYRCECGVFPVYGNYSTRQMVKVMEDDFQMFNACFGKRQKGLEHALAATKAGKSLMSEALSLVTSRAEHGKWSHVGKEEPT